MTEPPSLADLVDELTSACAERHACVERGDEEAVVLLSAWIDALLDEWNRRTAAAGS